jgi:transposase
VDRIFSRERTPRHRRAWREVLDHLGLVAEMFDELGIGDVVDRAMQHHPDTHMVTVGNAVNVMVLNGRGFVNQQLSLVPRCVQNQPTQRRSAPGIVAPHLPDDTLGRALDRVYDDGVTALSSLIAATAAQRLGLAPMLAHLDRTSCHGDGRDNRAEEPDAEVSHMTRGYSRDHRPDRNHVMLALIGEPQAGVPLLMPSRRGHSRDTQTCGEIVTARMQPRHMTDGTTDLVADSALYRADHLH